MVNALQLETVTYDGEFNDVQAGSWYADMVATAATNGIIGGYPDDTFKPNQEVSRLEMAVMLGNALKDVKLNSNAAYLLGNSFNDSVNIADWGREAAAKATQEELMNGMDGQFNPRGKATRAQAATVIYKLFNLN